MIIVYVYPLSNLRIGAMSHNKADLLLHPIRIRIMTELINQQYTTAQLGTALPDVPQATLYRHMKMLQDGGIIEVIEETPVNGAIERTYRLTKGAHRLSPEDLQGVTPEEHIFYFNTFVASLVETFARYVNHADLDNMVEDGMSYNRAVIYLSPEERIEFQQAMMQLVSQYISLPASPDRQRFNLASIVIPDERETPK